MPLLQSDALILFGASGDLAHKKILPALYAMFRREKLNTPVIGVARSRWSLDEFKAHVLDAIRRRTALIGRWPTASRNC